MRSLVKLVTVVIRRPGSSVPSRVWLGRSGAVALAASVALGLLETSSVSEAATRGSPQARLKWSIGKRYQSGWQHWDQSKSKYSGGGLFVHPRGAEATFDLCGSVAPQRITSYALTLQGVGSTFRWASTSSKCVKRFRPAQNLDGQNLPCFDCEGPELPYGIYDVTYSVSTGPRRDQAGPSTTERIEIRDYLVVSLGDSLASGEGAPDSDGLYEFSRLDKLDVLTDSTVKVTEKEPVKWKDRRCHRSARSGHALLAEQLEDRDPHSSVTFISLACSGAEIDEGVLGPYAGSEPRQPEMPAQVDVLQSLLRDGSGKQRTVDVLMLQVGINDLDFSDIVVACAGNFSLLGTGDPSCFYDTGFGNKLAALRAKYERLGVAINRRFPGAEVYVADYPGDVFKGGGCGLLGLHKLGITEIEAQAFSAGGLQLNGELQRLASKFDWNYVGGVTEAFSPHPYCSASRWFNRVEDSFKHQGNKEGTAHPNHRGHEEFRDAFSRNVVVALKTSPSYRVQLTIHRIQLGSIAGTGERSFSIKVASRGDELFTESRSFKVANRGTLLVPTGGPLTYTRMIYEKPQPPRQLTQLSFLITALGGTLPGLHKPEDGFKPTCIPSAAGPCHVIKTPTGRYLASTPDKAITVEYSLSVRPINPATIPNLPPIKGTPKPTN
jgi:GDSL-like Lipase/Acylhydrolase family